MTDKNVTPATDELPVKSIAGQFRFYVGLAILLFWLTYLEAEELISLLICGEREALKDLRRCPHPSVSIRTWTFFGRWTYRDPRFGSSSSDR